MADDRRVGLMWHGDRLSRDTANLKDSRFAKAAIAFKAVGLHPTPVIYNDDFIEEVRSQLLGLKAVQVWVNPIENGRDRTKLDQLLREVACEGVQVFTHPDTILRMGTKQVLVDTKEMTWGSDVDVYHSKEEMIERLPTKLIRSPRVLKQLRGHSGGGIWKLELVSAVSKIEATTPIRIRHAQRGAVEEIVSYQEAIDRMAPYFEASGKMIDQQFQCRLNEGMIRVYMVESVVGGFGHQAIIALYPAEDGETPQPGPRLYYPPDQEEFLALGQRMETEWIPALLYCLEMQKSDLPLLWDADFMLGPKDEAGNDTYVLCEINVSSVSPYPEWANPIMAKKLYERVTKKS